MQAILDILTVMTEGSKGVTFIDRWIGYLGSGVFNAGFDFVGEMTGGSSQWAEYQLDRDLIQVQDYLACLMTALIDQAVYDIEHYMDQDKLNGFNAAINSVTTQISLRCGAFNCLNATLVPPSARNNATGGTNCAIPTKDVDAVCGNAPQWNATHPTYCGHDKIGECDGGTCYKVVGMMVGARCTHRFTHHPSTISMMP